MQSGSGSASLQITPQPTPGATALPVRNTFVDFSEHAQVSVPPTAPARYVGRLAGNIVSLPGTPLAVTPLGSPMATPCGMGSTPVATPMYHRWGDSGMLGYAVGEPARAVALQPSAIVVGTCAAAQLAPQVAGVTLVQPAPMQAPHFSQGSTTLQNGYSHAMPPPIDSPKFAFGSAAAVIGPPPSAPPQTAPVAIGDSAAMPAGMFVEVRSVAQSNSAMPRFAPPAYAVVGAPVLPTSPGRINTAAPGPPPFTPACATPSGVSGGARCFPAQPSAQDAPKARVTLSLVSSVAGPSPEVYVQQPPLQQVAAPYPVAMAGGWQVQGNMPTVAAVPMVMPMAAGGASSNVAYIRQAMQQG